MNCRRLLAAFMLGLLAFVGFAWYIGSVPVFNGPTRAGLRHALNLWILPFHVTINAGSVDSWTDYVLRADISIDPKKFGTLLAGRSFVRRDSIKSPGVMLSDTIEGHQGFPIFETWDCGSYLSIQTNATRDRVFVLFSVD